MSILKPKDERRAQRRMVSEEVACAFGPNKWKAFLTDISSTGIFVESQDIPPLGSHLLVDFTLPFQSKGVRVHFSLRGVVARILEHVEDAVFLQPNGFSLLFLELSPKERLCLEQFCSNKERPRASAAPSATAQTRP